MVSRFNQRDYDLKSTDLSRSPPSLFKQNRERRIMPRTLFTADQHIHPHSGSFEKMEHCLEAFRWVYQVAESEGVSSVVSLGDLFHDRQKIHTAAYQRAYEILLGAKEKGVQTYLLLGNHDMYLREAHSIHSIKPLEGVARIITEPETLEIDGIRMDFLPYTETPREALEREFRRGSRSRILCGHFAVSGGIMNQTWGTKYREEGSDPSTETEVDPALFGDYELVLLGHFHSRQCLQKDERVHYVGSPLQVHYGDAHDSRGVTLLDHDTFELRFVENTFSPRYFVIPHDADLGDFDLKGGNVRLVAPSDLGGVDLLDLKKDILETSGASVVEIVTAKESDNRVVEEALDSSIIFTENKGEMLERYLEATGVPEGLDPDRLLRIGIELAAGN